MLTLNQIEQRKEVLTYIEDQTRDSILKAKSLIDLVMDDVAEFDTIKAKLVPIKDRVNALETARSHLISLVATGARRPDRTLSMIQQKLVFGEATAESPAELAWIERILPTGIIWKTSTGPLMSMVTLMAAIVGALVSFNRPGQPNLFAR